MHIETGDFNEPEKHHTGWFRVFRFKNCVEIWAGSRWIVIDWRKDTDPVIKTL